MAGRPNAKSNLPQIPDLFTLSLECLASHPEQLNLRDLVQLPEEVALGLFNLVIAKGKLTPRLVQLFEDAEQELVISRVAALGITKWTPPLIKDTRKDYLGQKPPWW